MGRLVPWLRLSPGANVRRQLKSTGLVDGVVDEIVRQHARLSRVPSKRNEQIKELRAWIADEIKLQLPF